MCLHPLIWNRMRARWIVVNIGVYYNHLTIRRGNNSFEPQWHTILTRCTRGDERSFFCTYITYLYAQNEISYEYIQILF